MISGLVDELLRNHVNVRLLMPAYKFLDSYSQTRSCEAIVGALGKPFLVRYLPHGLNDVAVPLYLAAPIPDASGPNEIYPAEAASSYDRFASLSAAAAWLCHPNSLDQWTPTALHVHDWHAGLAFSYLNRNVDTVRILTVHNAFYSGDFRTFKQKSGLPSDRGDVFLASAVKNCNIYTTVSEDYSKSIALALHVQDEVMQEISKRGPPIAIRNGVCYVELAKRYNAVGATPKADLWTQKASAKRRIQDTYSLGADEKAPLVLFTNRLTRQKSIDKIIALLPELSKLGLQLIVHGDGDEGFGEILMNLAPQFGGSLRFIPGHNETLEAELMMASDFYYAVSDFEPFGYSALHAMYFGCIPIVRSIGGAVHWARNISWHNNDFGNSVIVKDADERTILDGFVRSLKIFADSEITRKVMIQNRSYRLSWQHPANKYIRLYGRHSP